MIGVLCVYRVYLRNPMEPPDVSGIQQDDNPTVVVEDRTKKSGGQFNYSKLKSEKPSSKGPKRPPPPSKKASAASHKGSQKGAKAQQSPSGSKRPVSVTSAVQNDQPLIDLSDETVSLGAENRSLQPANTHLSLFDSLVTGSNAPHYGNIDLPKPLINDSPTRDPFDISPSLRLHAANTHSLNGAWPKSDGSFRSNNSGGRADDSGLDTSWPGSTTVNGHRNSVGGVAGDSLSSSPRGSVCQGGGLYYSLPPTEDAIYQRTETSQHSTVSSSLTATARSQVQRDLEHTFSTSFTSAFTSNAATSARPLSGDQNSVRSNASQSNGAIPGLHSSSFHAASAQSGLTSPGHTALWSDKTGQSRSWSHTSSSTVQVLPKLPPPGSLQLHHIPPPSHSKPLDPKADKAFDWLNDAISSLALSRATSALSPTMASTGSHATGSGSRATGSGSHATGPGSGSPAGVSRVGVGQGSRRQDFDLPRSPPPRYDEVPREGEDFVSGSVTPSQQHGHSKASPRSPCSPRPPLYEQVPREEGFQQAQRYGNIDNISAAFSSVQCSSASTQQYACASEFSDDFDDDEFDDEFYDASPSRPCNDPPPPLPPKDYRGEEGGVEEGVRGSPEKPHIFPVVQDGKQLSHTHYFLIPPKDRPPSTVTATVRPFSVDCQPYCDEGDGTSHADYQNISVAASHLSVASHDSAYSPSRTDTRQGSSPRRQRNTNERSRLSHGRTYSKSSSSSSPSKSLRSQEDSRSYSSYSDTSSADFTAEGGNFGAVSPRERVAQVQSEVLGVTDEECHTALCHCHWDVLRSVRYLKVEQLFRLGVASRPHCHTLLEALQWNLELASTVLMDEVRGKVQCESSV
ncbi:hypothetical protein V1264_007005 [Littorina saxatilis]|uniref:Uncharacterized protein n=1 Tax=Littorina saxatilis TaxID=31220 RepID=A0AAN9ATU7_9CAEN